MEESVCLVTIDTADSGNAVGEGSTPLDIGDIAPRQDAVNTPGIVGPQPLDQDALFRLCGTEGQLRPRLPSTTDLLGLGMTQKERERVDAVPFGQIEARLETVSRQHVGAESVHSDGVGLARRKVGQRQDLRRSPVQVDDKEVARRLLMGAGCRQE